MNFTKKLTAFLAVVFCLCISACGGGGNSTPPPPPPSLITLQSVSITPVNPSIPLGQTRQFGLTGMYSDGTTGDLTPLATWTSSAPSIATINGAGLATSMSTVGATTIKATSGLNSASTVLTVTAPATPTVALSLSPLSPVATNKARTTTGFFDVTIPVVANTVGSSAQTVAISGVTAIGTLASGIRSVQLMDGATVVGAAPVINGHASFPVASVIVSPASQKSLTIKAEFDPAMAPLTPAEFSRTVKFGFGVSDIAVPQGVNLLGTPLYGNDLVVEKGKLVYPCLQAICSWDVETGTPRVLYVTPSASPDWFVASRDGKLLAFTGANIGGMMGLNLLTGIATPLISGGGTLDTGCTSSVGLSDLSTTGDVGVAISSCITYGGGYQFDVFLVLTNNSLSWARVTNNTDQESSPVIASAGSANSQLKVCFASAHSGGEVSIYCQDIILSNPVGSQLVGGPVLLANTGFIWVPSKASAVSLSVSGDYKDLAFTKNISGVSHIMRIPVNGGTEVDLGEGYGPYWSRDGSGRILYTSLGGVLMMMNADGSAKHIVSIPSNIDPPICFSWSGWGNCTGGLILLP